MNDYKRVLDGQWQGIRYASDGNVYFGSSTHSAHHGAAFFKYDPRTRLVTMLAEDITTICGENPERNPQGKLHSDIVEANGWLYMSTHFASDRQGDYASWTGSHVIGYELATGRFRDYGVIHPNYDSYSGIGVDAAHNYIYVFVTGELSGQVSYLYRIDAVTGAKLNLGQVGGTFNACMWLFVDRRGDVWFSIANQNGTLRRYRQATGQLEVYANVLPRLTRWDRDQVDGDSVHQNERWIRWMQPLDGDRAVFTLGYYGGTLYQFDSTQPIGSGLEFRALKHIGYTDLGLALGNNRVFYYQRANRGYGHQGDQTTEGIRDFHLLSVSLNPADSYAITDHGLIKDQSGRLVWRVPGMMTDDRNRVFMVGDWWTIPGDLGSLRYHYSGGQESYEQLPRGEFFAVAEPVIPTPGGVVVTPPAATLFPGQTQPFTANMPVNWSLNPIFGSISAAGVYSAPASIPAQQTVTVTATSQADPARSATATITLTPPISVQITPPSATLNPGQSQQFTANTPVTWTLNPAVGTLTAAGAYTAPASVPVAQTVTVTARSTIDMARSASAVVTLNANPVSAGGTAAYLSLDTATRGTWKGVYGADGYNVIGNAVSYPSYVAVTTSGANPYTWSPSTSDARALQKASGTDRIAGTWYNSGSFQFDLAFQDTAQHRVALYFLDWDSSTRVQTVAILDGNNTVLDARTVSGFRDGQYVVWNMSGRVRVRVTRNAGANAVLSGLFFGAAGTLPQSPVSSAAFVKLDAATHGTWRGVYGAQAYQVVGNAVSYPAYVTVSPSGANPYTWTASTTDVRAPQKAPPATDRIAGTWYNSTFTLDLAFKDSAPHQVALYVLDWDSAARAQTVTVLDPAGTVLDTRTLSGFHDGQYLVWKVTGHVKIRVTRTAGANAVVSALFFDPAS